jgi:ankyrin repeat protein
MSYLLAWEPALNIQDNEGFTPLHLAVCSIESMKTTRLVRFVLLRGAEKEIKDKKGKTPIDYTRNITDDYLREEV